MSEPKKFFICGICGNQVEMIEDGGSELICCGEPMMHLASSCEAAMDEKHELVIEETDEGLSVQVGKNEVHPSTPAHFIQWIECWIGNRMMRHHLMPNDPPKIVFHVKEWMKEGEKPRIRAYCNIHGMRCCRNCDEKNCDEKSCPADAQSCGGKEMDAEHPAAEHEKTGTCGRNAASCHGSAAV